MTVINPYLLVIFLLCTFSQSQNQARQQFLNLARSKPAFTLDEQAKKIIKSEQVGQNKIFTANRYRFERNATLNDKFFKIKELNPIDNQNISLIAQPSETDANTIISQYSGSNFQTKLSSVIILANESIKIASKKMYINRKDSILQQRLKPLNLTLNASYVDSKVIIKDGYLYNDYHKSSAQFQCQTLWRVSLDTGAEELVKYEENLELCIVLFPYPLIADSGGNFIAYLKTIDHLTKIFLIDTQTAKLSSQFNSICFDQLINGKTNIEFMHDAQTNQSKITVFCGNKYNAQKLESFLFNHTSQKYESAGYIRRNCTRFTLTGFDQGVCTNYGQIQHYNKITGIILYISTQTPNDKNFIGRSFELASSNESLLIMYPQSSQRLEIYSIDQKSSNFQTQKLFQIKFQGNLISSSLTSDDKKLFIFSAKPSKQHPLTVYNFDDQNLLAKIQQEPFISHLAFALFESSYDRFILLIKKQTTTKNEVTYTHHLQIRLISNPQNLVREIPLPFLNNQLSFGYSLKADKSSKLTFLILLESVKDDEIMNDISQSYLCSLVNDNLYEKNNSSKLSYWHTYIGSSYIISFPYIQQMYSSYTIRVYDKESLSLLKEIPSFFNGDPRDPRDRNSIVFKDDILIFHDNTFDRFYRFDFGGSKDGQGFGKMTKLQSLFQQYDSDSRFILLKTKGLIISYKIYPKHIWQLSKIVLNASLPIDKVIQIPKIDTGSNEWNPYIPRIRNANLKCDTFVYKETGEWNYFSSLRNCEPYEPPRKYSIRKQGDKEEISYSQVYRASTNHHILTYARIQQTRILRLQLRSVNRDYQILWEKEYSQDIFYNDTRWMDFTDDGFLILKGLSQDDRAPKVLATFPQILNSAQNYEMKSFIEFDINDLGSIAFVGESVLSTLQKPIISITIIDKNKVTLSHRNILLSNKTVFTPQKIKAIALDELNSKAVFCYEAAPENITFLAWEFVSPYDRILDLYVTGSKINKLQFIGSDRLLFDLDGQIKIVQLDFNKTQVFKNVLYDFPSSQMYAISKDGKSFAFLNGKQLEIYGQNQTIIEQIELQLENTAIQAMKFGLNDTLFLIDNNSTITIFTNQVNCSHGYTNQKGYCLCLQPLLLIGEKCTTCLEGEYVFERSCQQCSFWCQQCEGSSTSCVKYSAGFYGILIGGSFLMLVLIMLGVWLVKRWKSGNSSPEEQESKEESEKSQKSASDLLAEDTLSKPLQSQQSEQN